MNGDLLSNFKVVDQYTGDTYNISAIIKGHALDRFEQRSSKQIENYVENAVKKAAEQVVNTHMSLPGEYLINSKNLNIKIPMIVDKNGNTLDFYVPTVLKKSMLSSRNRYNPVLTVEELQYSLYKEIFIE